MWPILLLIAVLGFLLTFRALLTLVCIIGFTLIRVEAPFAAHKSFAQGLLGLLLLGVLLAQTGRM